MERLQAMVGAEKTGVYDAQTMEKIMTFQRRLGLKGRDVDGIYGAGTRRALQNTEMDAEEAAKFAAGDPDDLAVKRASLVSKRNRK